MTNLLNTLDKTFCENSKNFYTNQINSLQKLVPTENVVYLIKENKKELQRVNDRLKKISHGSK